MSNENYLYKLKNDVIISMHVRCELCICFVTMDFVHFAHYACLIVTHAMANKKNSF